MGQADGQTKVFLIGEARRWYECEGKRSRLLPSILRSFEELATNMFSGTQIPKYLIPHIYRQRHDVRNLWKINLAGGWRLIYTLRTMEEGAEGCYILEIMDHKTYEWRFGYG